MHKTRVHPYRHIARLGLGGNNNMLYCTVAFWQCTSLVETVLRLAYQDLLHSQQVGGSVVRRLVLLVGNRPSILMKDRVGTHTFPARRRKEIDGGDWASIVGLYRRHSEVVPVLGYGLDKFVYMKFGALRPFATVRVRTQGKYVCRSTLWKRGGGSLQAKCLVHIWIWGTRKDGSFQVPGSRQWAETEPWGQILWSYVNSLGRG
jgi:hypothetical protein